jgi:hypothetical protein
MFTHFKRKLGLCSYQISSDGQTLYTPDCQEEKIYPGEFCAKYPYQCFEMLKEHKEEILASQFCKEKYPLNCYTHFDKISNNYGTTKVAVELKKKTTAFNLEEETITSIVVPSGTDIHFQFGNYTQAINRVGKNRVAKAVVKEQRIMKSSELVPETISRYRGDFKYRTGEVVEPQGKFYDWKNSIKHKNYDATCESGIHAFLTESEAESYW